MNLELGVVNSTATFEVVSKSVFTAIDKDLDLISFPAGLTAEAAQFIKNISLAAMIDFPFGLDLPQVRVHSILNAHRRGADTIELVLNHAHIIDAKYKQIRADIKACQVICETKNIDFRVIIEYRLLTNDQIFEICGLLKTLGVDTVITATGTILDDLMDNLIIAGRIVKKYGLKVIAAGRFYSIDHIRLGKGANLHAMRFLSYQSVEKLYI